VLIWVGSVVVVAIDVVGGTGIGSVVVVAIDAVGGTGIGSVVVVAIDAVGGTGIGSVVVVAIDAVGGTGIGSDVVVVIDAVGGTGVGSDVVVVIGGVISFSLVPCSAGVLIGVTSVSNGFVSSVTNGLDSACAPPAANSINKTRKAMRRVTTGEPVFNDKLTEYLLLLAL